MKLSFGNVQHPGTRSEQQDAFAFNDIFDAERVAHAGYLSVVADGMGGLANGREASTLAVKTFLEAYAAKTPETSVQDALVRALFAANRAVCDFASSVGTLGQTGSTLVAAAITEQGLSWISVGDSRCYLARPGRPLRQLTQDHDYAINLEKMAVDGNISLSVAATHPEREALTSFLGMEDLVLVGRNADPEPLEEGDWVVLCTDGIYNAIPKTELEGCLQEDPQKAANLVRTKVLEKGWSNQDNLTLTIMGVSERLPQETLAPGAAAPRAAAKAPSGFYRQGEARIEDTAIPPDAPLVPAVPAAKAVRRPGRRKSGTRVILLALLGALLAVVAGAVWLFLGGGGARPAEPAKRPAIPQDEGKPAAPAAGPAAEPTEKPRESAKPNEAAGKGTPAKPGVPAPGTTKSAPVPAPKSAPPAAQPPPPPAKEGSHRLPTEARRAEFQAPGITSIPAAPKPAVQGPPPEKGPSSPGPGSAARMVQPPRIFSFTSKPGRIEPGSSVTLQAAFEAGPDAKAYASSSGFAGIVPVENGKPVQSPPFKDPGRTADFAVVLTVSNSAGQVSRSVTVRVVSSGIVFRGGP